MEIEFGDLGGTGSKILLKTQTSVILKTKWGEFIITGAHAPTANASEEETCFLK